MSAVAEDAPASSRPVDGPPSLMARANAASRFLGRTLAWAADVRWRDGLAIALSAGALAGSALVVVNGLRENSNAFVILGAVTALLTVAGQFAIRREMLQRQAESRSYWFRSSPRGLAEVDADLQFMEGNSRLASLLAIKESELAGTRLTSFFDDHDAAGIVSEFRRLLDRAAETIESDD